MLTSCRLLAVWLFLQPASGLADAQVQALRVANELRAERAVAARAQESGWHLLLDAHHKGALRQGPDQVWRSPDGRLRIIEVKAGRSPLGHGYGFRQGSPGWAVRSVQKLATSSAATPEGRSIGKTILRSLAQGRPASVEVYRHLARPGGSVVERVVHHPLRGEAQLLARAIVKSGFPAPVTGIRFAPGALSEAQGARAVMKPAVVEPLQPLARASVRAVAQGSVRAIRRVKIAPTSRRVVKLALADTPTARSARRAAVVLAQRAVSPAGTPSGAGSVSKASSASKAAARGIARQPASATVGKSAGRSAASALRFAAPVSRLVAPVLGGAAVALVAFEAAERCADPSIPAARCAAFIGRQGIAWGGAAGAAWAGAKACAPFGWWAAVCSGGAAVAVGLGLDLGLESAGLD